MYIMIDDKNKVYNEWTFAKCTMLLKNNRNDTEYNLFHLKMFSITRFFGGGLPLALSK